MNEQELLVRLREAFQVESRERLTAIGLDLIALEKEPDPAARQAGMERVYREAHSLKGAARAVNRKEVETICQALEGALAALKRGEIALSPPLFDAVHGAVSWVERLVVATPEATPITAAELAGLVHGLEQLSRGGGEMAAALPRLAAAEAGPREGAPPLASAEGRGAAAPEAAVPLASTVRIATEKMDQILMQAEELIALKLAGNQHLAEIREMQQTFELGRKKIVPAHAAWRAARKKGNGAGPVGGKPLAPGETDKFLDWSQDYFQGLALDLRTLAKRMGQQQRNMGRMIDELLGSVKQMLMLPSATLLNTFPRMVREIAREQGKEVELQVVGGEVEVDRRILEEMKDPLTHLLRNALDHGVEAPAVRRRAGKPPQGVIRLAVLPFAGEKMEIRLADDGVGLNLGQIKASAIRNGLLTAAEAEVLGEKELTELIYHSGVSSAAMVTEISGRGLGMAIVREKVEKLGGTLELSSVVGRGTEISIRLPLSLASFRGVVVRVEGHLFIVPSMQVASVVQVERAGVQMVENRATFLHQGRPLSLVELGAVLGLAGAGGERQEGKLQVAVLGRGERRIGFRVDEVLGEEEVLVKSLGSQLRKVRNLAGATILGSGKVVPILQVKELLESAAAVGAAPPRRWGEKAEEVGRKSILVVEDSITSRILLKNILEAAGYQVLTAIDGLDGLTVLKTTPVDLVISDVEMPRMNGFELTAQIRGEGNLAHLPLILVTSLASREDRERGVEAGANAYILKSDFDQGNLLEVVARLA